MNLAVFSFPRRSVKEEKVGEMERIRVLYLREERMSPERDFPFNLLDLCPHMLCFYE